MYSSIHRKPCTAIVLLTFPRDYPGMRKKVRPELLFMLYSSDQSHFMTYAKALLSIHIYLCNYMFNELLLQYGIFSTNLLCTLKIEMFHFSYTKKQRRLVSLI